MRASPRKSLSMIIPSDKGLRCSAAPPLGWRFSSIEPPSCPLRREGEPILIVLVALPTFVCVSRDGSSLYISTSYFPLGRKSVGMLTVRASSPVIAATYQSEPLRQAVMTYSPGLPSRMRVSSHEVGKVLNSRKWLYELKHRIVEAKDRGEAVWLTIK